MGDNIPPTTSPKPLNAPSLSSARTRPRPVPTLSFVSTRQGPDFPPAASYYGSRQHRPDLQDRPRSLQDARQVGPRAHHRRTPGHHRHRDPLPGNKFHLIKRIARTRQRKKSSTTSPTSRRITIRGRHAHRHRTQARARTKSFSTSSISTPDAGKLLHDLPGRPQRPAQGASPRQAIHAHRPPHRRRPPRRFLLNKAVSASTSCSLPDRPRPLDTVIKSFASRPPRTARENLTYFSNRRITLNGAESPESPRPHHTTSTSPEQRLRQLANNSPAH